MIGKIMRLLILLTMTMALPRAGVFGMEPMPPRALAQIGDHRFYHGHGIVCAVLSPDGKRVASAAHYPSYSYHIAKERDAYDPVLVLWDATTGERLRELRVPHMPVSHLAFSPDGTRLAAAYGNYLNKDAVAVFEVETGKLLWQRDDFKSGAGYLQFSTDSKQLRVSERLGSARACDAATGKQLRLWKPPSEMSKGDKNRVCGVIGRLSPDGKVIVWEMRRLRERQPSWTWDAVGLHVQDAVTNKLLYQKKFHLSRPLLSIAFSANGQRFSAYCEKLTVWETATGKELFVREVPKLEGFAWTPDGQHAVSYGISSRLRWWDLETENPSRDLYLGFVSMNRNIIKTPQVFSADGKTLLLATDSTLRLFDTTKGKERAVPGHRAAVTPRFSDDGRTLFTSCNERRCRWDVTSGKEPTLVGDEPRKVWETRCLVHSTNERLFLDYVNRRVRLRETATGRVLHTLENGVYARAGLISPDEARVLLWYYTDDNYSEMLFRLYDSKTGKPSDEIKSDINMKPPVFSPDGRLVAWADQNAAIHLHDAVTGKFMRTLRSSPSFSKAESVGSDLHFSPDGEQLIAMTYYYDPSKPGRAALPMRVFQVSNGREILRFYVNPEKTIKAGELSCMACSPDGRLLAVAERESGVVRLLEIASGKVRAEFAGHCHGVHGLAFAPDGKTLASGGEDNVVFLWDVTGAKTLTSVQVPREKDLASWWRDLTSADGKRAGTAIAGLLCEPEVSIAFLQERLRPAETPDEKRLVRLLADLDSDVYETRQAASRELARLGERAETALRRALSNRPALEMRRRIEDLLDKLEPSPPPPETLRTLRAIEVLEHIGTPAARCCLESLAKGTADARPTGEAKRALDRLAKRR